MSDLVTSVGIAELLAALSGELLVTKGLLLFEMSLA